VARETGSEDTTSGRLHAAGRVFACRARADSESKCDAAWLGDLSIDTVRGLCVAGVRLQASPRVPARSGRRERVSTDRQQSKKQTDAEGQRADT
jgi:hypothetical protein